MTSFRGSCLCGAVTFEGAATPSFVSHCCCIDCRKSSGTGHSTDFGVTDDDIRIQGTLSTFSNEADSGNTITRHFCTQCGSKIATSNSTYPNELAINIAALDKPDTFAPNKVYYASSRIPWDAIS